jgi:hypothetical protein
VCFKHVLGAQHLCLNNQTLKEYISHNYYRQIMAHGACDGGLQAFIIEGCQTFHSSTNIHVFCP